MASRREGSTDTNLMKNSSFFPNIKCSISGLYKNGAGPTWKPDRDRKCRSRLLVVQMRRREENEAIKPVVISEMNEFVLHRMVWHVMVSKQGRMNGNWKYWYLANKNKNSKKMSKEARVLFLFSFSFAVSVTSMLYIEICACICALRG